MKFISLFSGIGGFDLAFERAGMECVAVCEIDKNAQSVLRRQFPKAELFDDVRKVGKETHGRKSVDLICGGFPCQDLSIAGKRAGLAGERSGLWFEFARIIDEIEPQWVVIENVPGLLSSNKGRDFAVILYWLVKRGYGVCWRVLDAQYFGVPQRRRRVFIVASFGNGSAAEVLFEQDGSCGDYPQSRETRKNATSTTIINLANSGANQNNVKQSGVMDTLDTWGSFAVMAHGQANAEIVSDGEPSLTKNHEAPILFTARDYGNDASFGIAPTMRSLSDTKGHQSGSHGLAVTVWHNHQQDGSIRIQEDGTAPTVARQWGTGGNNVPFVGVRRLMPIECERLQGFPDLWTDGQSDSARYKQLGNAVAVPVAEWIGKRIMAVTQPTKHAPDARESGAKIVKSKSKKAVSPARR